MCAHKHTHAHVSTHTQCQYKKPECSLLKGSLFEILHGLLLVCSQVSTVIAHAEFPLLINIGSTAVPQPKGFCSYFLQVISVHEILKSRTHRHLLTQWPPGQTPHAEELFFFLLITVSSFNKAQFSLNYWTNSYKANNINKSSVCLKRGQEFLRKYLDLVAFTTVDCTWLLGLLQLPCHR